MTTHGWIEAQRLDTSCKVICSRARSTSRDFSFVREVKKIGKAAVYDMTVAEYHNFLVNDGIVVSNCDTDRYVIYTDSQHALTGVY